jgi:hypothetical protein
MGTMVVGGSGDASGGDRSADLWRADLRSADLQSADFFPLIGVDWVAGLGTSESIYRD